MYEWGVADGCAFSFWCALAAASGERMGAWELGIGCGSGFVAMWRRRWKKPGVARKTQPLPSVLTPWRPGGVVNALPKPTAANLRRFAELPYVRRAMNIVKDRVASMEWTVRLKQDGNPDAVDAVVLRNLRLSLGSPNPSDSLRTVLEQVLEDTLVGGFGAVEIEPTGDPNRPVRLWPVDGATIQMLPAWRGEGPMRRAMCSRRTGQARACRCWIRS